MQMTQRHDMEVETKRRAVSTSMEALQQQLQLKWELPSLVQCMLYVWTHHNLKCI